MKKIRYYFSYMGLSSIIIMLFILIKKISGIKNKKIEIKIKNKKVGKELLTIRPFTTDLKLVKRLLVNNGEYDFLYQPEFNRIKDSKIIIDAGANIGIFSRIIREICKDALIIAIEPEEQNFKLMKKNLNGKQYICKKNGLWNKKSKLIVESSEAGEWGFTVKETKKDKYDILGISIVDIMKEKNINYIDVLKMDIEGSEYEVFDDSCDDWLDKVKIIIMEIHDKRKKWCSLRVMEQMKKHNFDYKIYNENYIFFKNIK